MIGAELFRLTFGRRRGFDRRGNFAGAKILPGAEISKSALVLSYIVWRIDFTLRISFPHKFSAQLFRLSFEQPPQFS